MLFLSPFAFSAKWYMDDNSNVNDIYTASSANGTDGAGVAGSTTAPFATLVYAISRASANDTIYVDKGVFSDNFFTLSKSLTIIGAGPSNTIFSSNLNHYFMKIAVSNVIIKNLTATSYGSSDISKGQVFDINGPYTGIVFDNIVMSNSYGSSIAVFGNIYIAGGASVTIKNSLSKCSGFNGSYGGGVTITGSTLNVIKSVFFNNDNLASRGGAIDIQGASTVTITDCTFDTNTATDGGAIGIQGTSNVTISGTCFLGNKTEGSSPASSNGGGAIYSNSTGTVNITDCSFTNNCTGIGFNTLPSASGAVVTCAPSGNSPKGGAIRQTAGTMNLTRVSFTSNNSSNSSSATDIQKDGGTMSLVDVTFNTINAANYVNVVNSAGTLNFNNSGQPVANGSGVSISKPEVTGTTVNANTNVPSLSPTTNCTTTSNITSCAVAVNCATEVNAPVIVTCVPNKTIAGTCASTMPDYRPELSAYDDCSYTVAQSPAPGTSLSPGSTYTVTMTVSDQSPNSPNATCTFTVTVTGSGITAPVVGTITQPTCSVATGSVALSGLPSSGTWTLTATPGALTMTGTGTTATFVGLTANTNYTFTVTDGVSGCVSPSTSPSAAISAQPSTPAPTGSATQAFCINQSATVNDLVATGTAIQWYLNPTGGTALSTSTALINNTHYYASQTVTGCESATRLDVLVTITPLPVAGTLSAGNATLCSGTSTTVSSTISGGSWSSSNNAFATVNSSTGLVNAIAAGTAIMTYTVSGTAACSATSATATINIDVTQTPVAGTLSAGDATLCSGTSTIVSSTVSGGSWSSSNNSFATVNSSTGLVNAIAAGTAVMTYTVSGTAGCTGTNATATINIDVTQAPTTGTLSATDATICSGTTSTVSSTISGGSWSSSNNAIATVNSSSGLVTGVAAGTAVMTYTVSGTAGCTGTNVTATINIDVTQAPTAGTLSAGDATLCSGTSTTVSSTVSGGSWSSSNNSFATVNSSSGLVNAIAAGTAVMTYTVSGTAGCAGTNATATINIDVTQAPSAGTLTPVGASLCLGGTTTMSSNVSGGTWISDSPGVASIDLNTGLVNALSVGTANMTYTVSGVSACLGTNSSASIAITIISSPTAGILTALDSTLCQGSTTTASSTSLGGTWVSSNTGIVTVDPNSGLVTAISNGTATLTYTVYGTGSCVGSNASATLDISVSIAPIAGTLSAVNPNLCAGSTTTVSSSVSGGTWTSSNTSFATVNPSTGLVTAISAGTAVMTYTVAGTSYCLGTNATAIININVTNAPTAGTLTALDSSLCSGTTTTVSSTISGGSWLSSNPSVATVVSNTGLVTAISAGSAIMTYTVNGTGVCAGVNASGTITIDVTQAPIAGTISSLDSTLCSGTTTIISSTISGGTWTSSNTGVATVDINSGLITAVSGGSTTITYTVNGSAACLGTNATGTLTINVTTAPDAGTLSAINATLCSGSTTTVSSTIIGGTWSSADNTIATVDANTGLVTALSVGNVSMIYTVNGSGACLGTNATASIGITVTNTPTTGVLSALDSSLCEGSTTIVSSTVTGGSWLSLNPSVATVDANTGLVTAISSGTATMSYTVTGSGACSGATATATLDIDVTAAPLSGSLSSLDSTLCSGTTTIISSSVIGGVWTSSNPTIATVNSSTGVISALSAGTVHMIYTVSGTGACLGNNALDSLTIVVTDAPSSGVLSLNDTTLCSGSSTSANSTVNGGAWSSSNPAIASIDPNTGLVTAISNGTAILTYTVAGSGACLGTNATATISVIVNLTPTAPTGDQDQYFCNSSTPSLLEIVTIPNTGITWYDASVSGNVLLPSTGLTDGGIYYATQSINGCESTSSLQVTVHLSYVSMELVSQTTPKCHKNNGSIEVVGINGVGSYSYQWSNGVSTALISNIGSGTYSITVTDSLGCSVSQSFDLGCTISEIPQIISPNGNGKNENWILNLDSNAKVEIYNRWGNLVYSSSPYNDDWNGKPNVGDATGKDFLPSGTYFYIINMNNGEKPLSGYIELVR